MSHIDRSLQNVAAKLRAEYSQIHFSPSLLKLSEPPFSSLTSNPLARLQEMKHFLPTLWELYVGKYHA